MSDPDNYPYLEKTDQDYPIGDNDGSYLEPFTRYSIKQSENCSFQGRRILEFSKMANGMMPIPVKSFSVNNQE
jgi:hypothetical protein